MDDGTCLVSRQRKLTVGSNPTAGSIEYEYGRAMRPHIPGSFSEKLRKAHDSGIAMVQPDDFAFIRIWPRPVFFMMPVLGLPGGLRP